MRWAGVLLLWWRRVDGHWNPDEAANKGGYLRRPGADVGSGMARDRDVAAFGERAQGYDEGWRGQLHHQIADRTADLARTCVPVPKRILDVGVRTATCSRLAACAPQAEVLAGIDAAPAMIEVARTRR